METIKVLKTDMRNNNGHYYLVDFRAAPSIAQLIRLGDTPEDADAGEAWVHEGALSTWLGEDVASPEVFYSDGSHYRCPECGDEVAYMFADEACTLLLGEENEPCANCHYVDEQLPSTLQVLKTAAKEQVYKGEINPDTCACGVSGGQCSTSPMVEIAGHGWCDEHRKLIFENAKQRAHRMGQSSKMQITLSEVGQP